MRMLIFTSLLFDVVYHKNFNFLLKKQNDFLKPQQCLRRCKIFLEMNKVINYLIQLNQYKNAKWKKIS